MSLSPLPRSGLAALLLLSSCATPTHSDFRVAQVKPGEGVAIGHVRVHYNGKPFTKNCSICFNGASGPCDKLTDDGLVFQPLPTGTNALRRISCFDSSSYGHTIEDAAFVQPVGAVYFGDVTIEWTNEGGYRFQMATENRFTILRPRCI